MATRKALVASVGICCVYSVFCAIASSEDSTTPSISLVDESIEALQRTSLSNAAKEFIATTEINRRGLLGTLISAHSSTSDLLRFRDSSDKSLSVLAEWLLTERELQGVLLQRLNRSVNDPKELNYALRRIPLLRRDPADPEESSKLQQFVAFLDSKADIKAPGLWRKCITQSSYCGQGVVQFDAEAMIAASEYNISKTQRLTVVTDEKKPTLLTIGNDGTWTIDRAIAVTSENIEEYTVSDDALYLILHSDADSPLDLTMYCFKRGQHECVWSKRCANLFDRPTNVGGNLIVAFAEVASDPGSITTFFLLPTSFSVDSLDLRTGDRKWCFSALLPKLLKP